MKFYVTYCITHPEHTPMTSTGLVEAPTRVDLEDRLERGIGNWKKRGYSIEIVKVACIDTVESSVQE
ncbi:MAG TPA: hypothetical protein VE843_05245 [Ktedonobacteraceae bacterium]|nr:hypothetical protein [Ktedonobacteraceae bacterium]